MYMGLLGFIRNTSVNTLVNVESWGKFKLTDLFEITGSTTTPKNQLDLDASKKYPYITTQATNNAVFGWSDKFTENGGVLVVDSAVLGTCTYQEYNFTASDHVEKLIPKFVMTRNIALFLCTIINKAGEFIGYSYGKKRSQKALKQESIYLPTTDSGTPDWQYMDSYIEKLYTEIEKLVE